MKKFATAILLAALLPLGACTVYGPGPAANGAWANYDFTYDYGHKGYDRPVFYGNYGPSAYYGGGYGGGYAGGHAGYGGGYSAGVSAGYGDEGDYGSYYNYGY